MWTSVTQMVKIVQSPGFNLHFLQAFSPFAYMGLLKGKIDSLTQEIMGRLQKKILWLNFLSGFDEFKGLFF